MQKTYILSKREVEEINKLYNTNLYSIMIQQIGNKYYAIIDCDIKRKIYKKEAMKYFES
ncbi:MAG: hypothetical protein SOV80_00020 [Bacilli bacterium]|nr:hypothetical protein [bacterium]MDY2696600.1 hypothetical protein [Bacilli bacterium]